MRVRLTKQAIRQIDAALGYVAAQSPKGAAGIGQRLYELLDLLAIRPRAGRKTNGKQFRQLGLSPYPYLIEYRIGIDEIDILRFRHGARRT